MRVCSLDAFRLGQQSQNEERDESKPVPFFLTHFPFAGNLLNGCLCSIRSAGLFFRDDGIDVEAEPFCNASSVSGIRFVEMLNL
jgi:hypothetical protein